MNKHHVGRIYAYAIASSDGKTFMGWPTGMAGAITFTHDIVDARLYATREVAEGVAVMSGYVAGCTYKVVCVEVTEVSTTTIKIVEDAGCENV